MFPSESLIRSTSFIQWLEVEMTDNEALTCAEHLSKMLVDRNVTLSEGDGKSGSTTYESKTYFLQRKVI